jgi:hypothetical protein
MRIRTMLTGAVAAGALAGAFAGGISAQAATAGVVVREQCTKITGKISYKPGLVAAGNRSAAAVLRASMNDCAGLTGSGTFTATVKGKARLGAQNFSGTFKISWPASAGLNPSAGKLTVSESHGVTTVYGTTTSGGLPGAPVHFAYRVTASIGTGSYQHPVAAQAFVNTQPLELVQSND